MPESFRLATAATLVGALMSGVAVADPEDIHGARRLASEAGTVRLGLFYCNPAQPRYDQLHAIPLHTAEEKIAHLERELDRNAV